jgi:glycosyltransferase involved in cell wall biosynthesis
MSGRRVLSVVVPAYNEERFIAALLDKIRAVDVGPLGFDTELIVVDDCSTDRTASIVEAVPGVRLVRQSPNAGKGSAVRAGIRVATGDCLIIQDADLEYDPQDYRPMLEEVVSGRTEVVYGSRYLKRRGQGALKNLLGGRHPQQSWTAYLGGQSLSFVCLLFTGRYLTDTVTALKLFPRPLLVDLALESSGFELDHEITAKVTARGYSIAEVPIQYFPRSRAEGKKIGLRDWFIAVRTFYRWRWGHGRRRA